MKKFIYIAIALMLSICFGCTVTKPLPQKTMNLDDMVEMAVADFLTTQLSKKGKIFSLYFGEGQDEIVSFSIYDTDFKVYLTEKDTIGSRRWPTKHLERDGKLFYWDDPDYHLTQDFIDVLKRYDHIQFVKYEDLMGGLYNDLHIDEKAKGAHYYFCKKNPRKFKRVITNIGIGGYDPPKLRCK